MDRRTLLTSIAGVAAVGGCSEEKAGAGKSGRPSLAIDAEGTGRWRVRSWQWRGGAWQPLIARARRTGAGIEWSGEIAADDKARVIARLGR